MIAIYKWVTKKNNWGDNRFFEQKNNTKKINPIFKQKLGMTLKQEITTWIPKSEFGLEHPISWEKNIKQVWLPVLNSNPKF